MNTSLFASDPYAQPNPTPLITAQFQSLGEQDHTTRRMLFNKLKKGIDLKDTLLATQKVRIEALEQELEDKRPKKRKKVEISPNSKFADIAAIRRTQLAVQGVEIESSESEASGDSDSSVSCIFVGN